MQSPSRSSWFLFLWRNETLYRTEKCMKYVRIIIGSDRQPETKGIEGKIDRFRSGKVRVRYN